MCRKKKETQNYSINIGPTPTNGILNIFINGFTENAIWQLSDSNNKNISKGSTRDSQIDLSSLPNGTYFLTITEGQIKKSKSIILIN